MLPLIDFRLDRVEGQHYYEISSTAIMLHTSGTLSLIIIVQRICWGLGPQFLVLNSFYSLLCVDNIFSYS